MRASPWCALAALCLACGGDPAASDGGGTSPADAAPAADSAIATCECDLAEVCAGGACVASECGDAILDPTAGEECDDGNETAFDGCEPDCTFTCRESSVCSDRDPCNGEEVCGAESHRCEAGTPLADASACSTSAQPNGVCRAETCVAAGCGNGVVDGSEECDDGNTVARDGCEMDCRLSCTTDAACDDRDACNGNETCDMETHACVPGTALSCDDASPCTNDSCDASLGCVFALIDADLDGQAPDSLASCGTDCNDMRDDVYLGAVELCDSIDHDCDGASLPAEAPLWYLDCDGDGHAGSGAFSVRQCDPPAPAACGGGYTARVPVGGDVDCDDARADVRPRLTEMTGDPTDTDENCDSMIACFEDADGDGYRTGRVVLSSDADCTDAGEARATVPEGDCDDTQAATSPAAMEIVGDTLDRDENCDGRVACFGNADGDPHRTSVVIEAADGDCDDAGEARASVPGGDCADDDPAIHPSAAEIVGDARDRDENCDGALACFADADRDGYRGSGSIVSADRDCGDAPEAYATTLAGDCDDTRAEVRPSATEVPGDAGDLDEDCSGAVLCFADADGDGYRTDLVITSADEDCADAGEARAALPAGDCDDSRATVSPGAGEVAGDASNRDENCDGQIACYADSDGDGHRTSGVVVSADADCADAGEALASLSEGDCLDTDPSVNPGEPEIAGDAAGLDEDCDGSVTCYVDNDGDGYRTSGVVVSADADCSDAGEALASLPSGDCADTNASVSPGRAEIAGDAGNLDEDCSGTISCYLDGDGDGARSASTMASSDADCADALTGGAREAYASAAIDCLDSHAAVRPGGTEVPGDAGNLDEDCSGNISCYVNADGDAYRTATPVISTDGDCAGTGEAYTVLATGDCLDTNASVHPGATELPGDAGDLDEDCSGNIACYRDGDLDGYRTDVVVTSANSSCADPGEAYAALAGGDCNDASAAIRPGAVEIPGDAADADEDCNGVIACYRNADNDTHRTNAIVASSNSTCAGTGEAYAALASNDCDDSSASIHPGAPEVPGDAGDRDENCDGAVTCYANADGDPRRIDAILTSSDSDCADTGEARASLLAGDCDDTRANVYPGATEVPGDPLNLDENCDTDVTCYADSDDDGSRTAVVIASADADCSDAGEEYASASIDCCDIDARAHPGVTRWYTTPTLCGSSNYDFDCVGGSVRRYTTSAGTCGSAPACSISQAGWSGGTPACGASGTWTLGCTPACTGTVCFCVPSTESRPQECH